MSIIVQTANRRSRRGFTLIELLVAILVLSLALVSLGQLYLAGMWTTQKARYMSLATQRAQAEMERVQDLGVLRLRDTPLNAYPDTEYQHRDDSLGVSFTDDTLPGGRGTVSWSAYPPNTAGNEHMLKVDIVISWDGAARTRSQVEVTTLLTNKK